MKDHKRTLKVVVASLTIQLLLIGIRSVTGDQDILILMFGICLLTFLWLHKVWKGNGSED